MNGRILIACAALAVALGACSKEPACDQAQMQKKMTEMQTAFQAAIAKDPSKAATLMPKAQEIATKYANADASQACKAIDELIKSVN